MRNTGLTVMFLASLLPGTIACADGSDSDNAEAAQPKTEANSAVGKDGEEAAEKPDQASDSLLLTQVKLVSSIMVDLQMIIEGSESMPNPAKLYKAMGTFQKVLVAVQAQMLEFDHDGDAMTVMIAKTKLLTKVGDLYFDLNELSKTLGHSTEETILLDSIRSKIALLRETLQ